MNLVALALVAPVSAAAREPAGRSAFNAHAGSVQLSHSQFSIGTGRIQCGLINGKWIPGFAPAMGMSGVKFVSYTRIAANYTAALRTPGLTRGQTSKYEKGLAAARKGAGRTCRFTPVRVNLAGAIGVAQGENARSTRSGRASTRDGSLTLNAVLPDGSLRTAISSGNVRVQAMVVNPDHTKLYLIFQQRVSLQSTLDPYGDCVLAEVTIATGIPRCVDTSLQNIQSTSWYSSYGNQAPLQFDAAGGVYYTGYGTCNGSCTYVLRRELDGVITDLVRGEAQVQSFTVAPNGMVFMYGWNPSTGTSFARRLLPSGSLRNLLGFGMNGGFRLFPDGNIYSTFNGTDCSVECSGIARYDVTADQQDDHLWIGDSHSTYDWWAVTGQMWMGSWNSRMATTSNGVVYFISDTHVDEMYPEPARFSTVIKTVAVATAVGQDVIIAGTAASGLPYRGGNLITRFDGATHTEAIIAADGIGAGEFEIYHLQYSSSTGQVLFDGLRYSDNSYVIGEIDAATNAITILSTNSGKLSDFQTF